MTVQLCNGRTGGDTLEITNRAMNVSDVSGCQHRLRSRPDDGDGPAIMNVSIDSSLLFDIQSLFQTIAGCTAKDGLQRQFNTSNQGTWRLYNRSKRVAVT